MEPKTLFINSPNNTNINDNTNNIIIDPIVTNIEESSDDKEETNKITNEPSDTNNIEKDDKPKNTFYFPKNKSNEGKINAIIIVFSTLGCVIILGLIIALSLYCQKKNNNIIINNSNSEINLRIK